MRSRLLLPDPSLDDQRPRSWLSLSDIGYRISPIYSVGNEAAGDLAKARAPLLCTLALILLTLLDVNVILTIPYLAHHSARRCSPWYH